MGREDGDDKLGSAFFVVNGRSLSPGAQAKSPQCEIPPQPFVG
jgi:hypothetical protein